MRGSGLFCLGLVYYIAGWVGLAQQLGGPHLTSWATPTLTLGQAPPHWLSGIRFAFWAGPTLSLGQAQPPGWVGSTSTVEWSLSGWLSGPRLFGTVLTSNINSIFLLPVEAGFPIDYLTFKKTYCKADISYYSRTRKGPYSRNTV